MAGVDGSATTIVDASDHGMTVFLDSDGLHGVHNPTSVGGSNTDLNSDDEGSPFAKKLRIDNEGGITETITIDWNDENVKQTMYNVNRALSLRLDSLEQKYENLIRMVQDIHEKITNKDDKTLRPAVSSRSARSSAIVVGLPSSKGSTAEIHRPSFSAPSGNVTLITLNSEEDYPSGVWLGDENNPEMRVRVSVSPSDLLHIHSNCRTAEKMALTLLDYLFDRDVQAVSNISGTGKHGKKQLDPLLIYGMRCHLIHRFGVSEEDWHRIRLNIDSKCRTAFRRKVRGQPMNVKAFRGKDGGEGEGGDGYLSQPFSTIGTVSQEDDSSLRIQEHLSLDGHTGELQIIHATEEQLAQLQQSHQIQILDDNQVPAELLAQLQQQAGSVDVQVAVTPLNEPSRPSDLEQSELTVNAVSDNGDVVQITQEQDNTEETQ